MIKSLFLTVMFICCHFLYGQDFDLLQEMIEDELVIRQKPNTENLLKEYLADINFRSDTVYAVLYSPMNCPRCEAVIKDFRELLKRDSGRNELLLIADFPDAVAAKRYQESKGYQADYYLYDTEENYNKIFSFSSGFLHIVYLLKICTKSGELLIGGNCPILDDEFVAQLVAFSGKMEKKEFRSGEVDRSEFPLPACSYVKGIYQDFMMENPKDFPISVTDYLPAFEGEYFFYSDKLWNGVMLFQVSDGSTLQFNTLLQNDSLEGRRFVKIPEEIYQNDLKDGSVYFMACSPKRIGEKHIGIAYSLPDMFVESQDENRIAIGYRNRAAILMRNLFSLEKENMITFQFDLMRHQFFYAHFVFEIAGNKVLLGCEKRTWPMEAEKDMYINVDSLNPFCEAFYKTENPYFAAFDKASGDLLYRFGNLQPCHAESRTGYCFTNPVAASWDDEVVYTDGCSGQLYVSKQSDLRKTVEHYSVFEVETDKFPPIDTTYFYTYEYIEPYDKFFYRTIEEIKMTSAYIYCLVRYGLKSSLDVTTDKYTFVSINRKSGVVEEFSIPYELGMTPIGYGLKDNMQEKIQPFLFFKKKDQYGVRVFGL